MIEVVDSILAHVRELSKTMREGDRLEAERAGCPANKALYYSFKYGVFRKTALIDGKVAAMWGVAGIALGIKGMPYLITSPLSETISPIKFAKIYTSQVKEMRKLFPVLESFVDAEYYGAVRLLKIAGFSLSKPLFINNHPYRKFTLNS